MKLDLTFRKKSDIPAVCSKKTWGSNSSRQNPQWEIEALICNSSDGAFAWQGYQRSPQGSSRDFSNNFESVNYTEGWCHNPQDLPGVIENQNK